jgi:transposase
MPRRQMTQREKRDVIERYVSGECMQAIANDYDRSKKTIKNLVARYETSLDGDVSRKTKLNTTQKRAIVALVTNDPTLRLQEIHESN